MFASMKKALFTLFAGVATLSVAAEPATPVPQTIDISGIKGGAKIVEDVVIPVPSEIFSVLDKIGTPHWKEVLRTTKNVPTPSEREPIALLLGTVIAEGFIAVEATNTEDVNSIGRIVIQLSDALSVSKSVKKRATAIIDN